MGTLRTYTKPEGFTLPVRYERLAAGNNNGNPNPNYSYCRRVEPDAAGFTKYEIGVLFHLRGEITAPGPTTLTVTEYVYPKFCRYYVYIPEEGNIFFCIGNDMDMLYEPLLAHSRMGELYKVPIDLRALETAQRTGRIRVKGQTCITENRSLRITQRKIDGHTFTQNDLSFKRGEGVEQRCLELTINYEDKQKSFYVYPDGTITTKGRNESGVNDFGLLRRAYDQISRILRN